MSAIEYKRGPVPTEAINYFQNKQRRPAFDYRDVWREEHAISFTVAKAVQMDVLRDIQDGLKRALAEGETFEQFKQSLTPLLQQKGWWGKREMLDPETGEIQSVQLGSPRRLKTIYDANLRTARAAGQWERIQRNKQIHPYLVYRLGPSREHRADHASWEGTILPVDHPWWTTHFAPNGWGCKCRIVQVTQAKADQLLATGNYTTTAPPTETKEWHNKRTGQTEILPRGIDPGWDTNPGYLRQVGVDRALVSKALVLDRIDDARELMFSPVRVNEFKEWSRAMLQSTRPGGDLRTVAVLGATEIAFLASQGNAPEEILTVIEGRLMAQSGGHKANKAQRHKTAGNAL